MMSKERRRLLVPALADAECPENRTAAVCLASIGSRRVNRHCLAMGCMIVLAVQVCSTGVLGAQPRARTLKWDAADTRWVESSPPSADTPEGALYRIHALIVEGKYRTALTAIKRATEKHGTANPHYPAIMVAKAQALIGRRAYDKAYFVLHDFLDNFAGTAPTSDALRQLFVVAEAYLGGAKTKFLGLPVASGVDRAYEILDEISFSYADNPLAPMAIKTKADHLFKTGEHDLAEMEYERLLKDFPNSRYHQHALRRTADAALAAFAGVAYDDAMLVEADARFSEYRLRYPAVADHEGVGLIQSDIHARRAAKQFEVGRYYERTDHISSAVYYYRLVLERFGDTVAAARATRRLELLGAMEHTRPQTEPTDDKTVEPTGRSEP